MKEPELTKNSKMRKFGIKKKLWLYIVLTVCLLASGVYTVNALTDQVTNLVVTPDPIKLGYIPSISYTLGQDSKVNINIYKESGELVRSLLSNAAKLAGINKTVWDGKDGGGVLVPDGLYKIVVESLDESGAQSGIMEKLVTAARVPQISNVTDTPDPFNPLNNQKSQITYTISSDAIVTLKISKGSTTVITIPGAEAKPAGTYTMEWDGTDGVNVVGDGTYNYELIAVSPTVPDFKNTYKNTVVVEKEAPQITALSVTQNPLKLITANQFFKFALSENAAVTLRVYDSQAQVVRTVANAQTKMAGAVTLSWDGKKDDGLYVPEGEYRAVVNAVDNYGKNSGDQAISFTAGYQPAVTNAAITPDPYSPGAGNATIGYNISQNALVTVKILSGTSEVASVVTNQEQNKGDQTISWDGGGLGDGSYNLQITAVSPTVAGFSSTVKVPFSIAGTNLEITNFSTSPNPFRLGVGVLSIKYTLSEDATVNVKVYQGSEVIRNVASGENKKAGACTTVWDGKRTDGSYVPEGTYSVSVTGTDNSGNSAEVSGTFSAGYLPAISAVSAPQTFNPGSGAAVINFSLSHAAKVTLAIKQGTGTVKTFPAANLEAGANTMSWDGKDAAGQIVSDGLYTFEFQAVSPTVSEFNSIYRGTLTVEAADPVLSSLSVIPSPVRIGSSALLKYTVSEPATVTAKILKAGDCSEVKELPPGISAFGGISVVNWDTKDNAGNLITTGEYILVFSAVDNFAKTGSAELPFSAAAVPVISNVYSTPATVDLAHSNQVTFNYTISESSKVTVKVFDSNNVLVKTIYSSREMPAGAGTAVWDCTNNQGETVKGTFTFKIDATSVVGSFMAVQASGTVVVAGEPTGPPPPPTPTNCRDCHTTYPQAHPMNNCNACHGNNEPIEDCSQCHGGTHDYGVLTSRDCTSCHNETYSYKVPFHEGDINVLHQAPLNVACQDCHNASLNVEHPLHTNDAGQRYDCNTCHQSTVPEVVAAIDTGQKSCGSCHAEAGHDEVHTPTDIQPSCTSCHKDSLTQEHLNNPTTQTGNSWSCDTCHASTAPNVVYAINNGQKNCASCHTVAGHDQFHDTNNLDSNCLTCHNNNLSYEHLQNTKTQKDEAGNFAPQTCNTCHTSSDPIVSGAVATGNTQCAACHRTGHNISFVENVPGYVYKYPGFEWTPPQDALLWAGETWMPGEYAEGGKVIISNRRQASADGVVDSAAGAVFDYYNTKLTADNWVLVSAPPAQPNYFQVTYEKGTHRQTIWFYGGVGHTASPVSDAGYRIEVIYK
jgi:flagellar hook assembly protein FlgD